CRLSRRPPCRVRAQRRRRRGRVLRVRSKRRLHRRPRLHKRRRSRTDRPTEATIARAPPHNHAAATTNSEAAAPSRRATVNAPEHDAAVRMADGEPSAMTHVVVRVARNAGIVALFIIAAMLGILSGVMFAYAGDLPAVSALDNYTPSTITRIYSANG